jgi:hypothetical protein
MSDLAPLASCRSLCRCCIVDPALVPKTWPHRPDSMAGTGNCQRWHIVYENKSHAPKKDTEVIARSKQPVLQAGMQNSG